MTSPRSWKKHFVNFETDAPGDHISQHVPMRSVWLLQLYASEAYRRGVITDAAVEAADAELPVLLTTMLCEAVERRLTRELSVGFSRRAATLHRVRGKIDVYATQRHRLLDKGQIRCEFNELTSDHPVNRYLLRVLHYAENLIQPLNQAVATRCRRLARSLEAAGVPLISSAPEPTGRLSPSDVHPTAVASLLLNLFIPRSGIGPNAFARASVTETYLRALFERALLGIYRYHLTPLGWTVHGAKYLGWPLNSPTTAQLPRMLTDIMLTAPDGTEVIVDAKFAAMATNNRTNTGYTLKSGHLYQIQSYVLAHAAALATAGDTRPVSGVVVYATLGAPRDGSEQRQQFTIHGHAFTFSAIDLSGCVSAIRDGALAALGVDATVTPPSAKARSAYTTAGPTV